MGWSMIRLMGMCAMMAPRVSHTVALFAVEEDILRPVKGYTHRDFCSSLIRQDCLKIGEFKQLVVW